MSLKKIQVYSDDGCVETYEKNFFAFAKTDEESCVNIQNCDGTILAAGCTSLIVSSVIAVLERFGCKDKDIAASLLGSVVMDIALDAQKVLSSRLAEEKSAE